MRTTHCGVLVDDDPLFLSFAQAVISDLDPDCEFIAFDNAFDALDFLSQHRVAIIVTDLQMPFIDGFRLTSAVRAVDLKVPIVVMSADQIGLEVIARGANAFVSKPALRAQLRLVFDEFGLNRRGRKLRARAQSELPLAT